MIGPNGAGKTSLFNFISDFYEPPQGSIHYQGAGSQLGRGGAEGLHHLSQVKRFHLLVKELHHDDGEVTATMKVRRSSIYKNTLR